MHGLKRLGACASMMLRSFKDEISELLMTKIWRPWFWVKMANNMIIFSQAIENTYIGQKIGTLAVRIQDALTHSKDNAETLRDNFLRVTSLGHPLVSSFFSLAVSGFDYSMKKEAAQIAY